MVSLVVAIGAAYFTNQQASEAKCANDMLAATKAAIVYIEVERTPEGLLNSFVANRNKEPIFDVYYTYKVGGSDSDVDVRIGLLPPCSKVKLTPPGRHGQQEDFTPSELLLRDANGISWRRDESGQVSPLQTGAISVGKPETIGTHESIANC